jgi:hypothetical protein
MTYALGRGLQSYDMPQVRKIVRDSDGYRFTQLILGIINSPPFQLTTTPIQTRASNVGRAILPAAAYPGGSNKKEPS